MEHRRRLSSSVTVGAKRLKIYSSIEGLVEENRLEK
jgi:hypothetical protein